MPRCRKATRGLFTQEVFIICGDSSSWLLRSQQSQANGQHMMDDFDDKALQRWKTLPPDQKDAQRIRSGVPASSSKSQQKTRVTSFNVAPLWPIAAVDCPCSRFGLSKHMDDVDVGRPASLPQAGLRHLEEMSRAYMRAEHGPQAPNQLAHAKLSQNDALDPDAEAVKRRAKRDCSTARFGVCRSDPLLRRPLFSKTKRVANSLYNGCNSMGEKLYMIMGIGQTICTGGRLARFLLPSWSLSKPHIMLFTEATYYYYYYYYYYHDYYHYY